MNINDFVIRLTEEFDDETQAIEAHTAFRSLDMWSSMQALIVIARINEDYGVLLSEEDLQQSQTFTDLFDRVVALK
jgi:acyl carrier protein